MLYDVVEIFYLSPFTQAEVDMMIAYFKDSAPGRDELKQTNTKTVKNSIKSSCTHWQSDFKCWNIPDWNKIAKFVSIFYGLKINYTKINVWPLMTMIKHKTLCEYHFGFHTGKSTYGSDHYGGWKN